MHLVSRKHIPLIFLIFASAWWGYFYQSRNFMNDYGASKPEWLYLIDGFIVLPFLCYICIKDKKLAALKSLAYAGIVVLIGSYVIPEQNKYIWIYLESGRYLLVFMFLAFEAMAVATVMVSIKALFSEGRDPDRAITDSVYRVFGHGNIGKILSLEARVWSYVLFSKRVRVDCFDGDFHFSCFKKDGVQNNLLGFILIIIFELPIVHVLLHFFWSPSVANIITVVTLLGLAFFYAEYKAIAIRPISIDKNYLIIRYGIWNPVKIPLSSIASVNAHKGFVKRSSKVKRYNLSGDPNVVIQLNSGHFDMFFLGLDNPKTFIEKLHHSVFYNHDNDV